jgi:hypothetical protein
MTDPEQDETFENYLKRRSVLPDDRLEPPVALDAIVLKKAREAIKAPAAPDTGKQQMQRAPRWAVPVALAATIMLCLSVVMNISLNTNRPTPRLAAARGDGDRRESVPGDIPSREVILPEAKVAEAPAPHAPVVAEQQGLVASAPSAEAPPPSIPGAPAAPAPGAGASGSRELKRTLTAPDAFGRDTQAAPAGVREAAPSAADKATMFGRRADASVRGNAPSAAEAAPDTEASATARDRATAAAAEGPKHPADPKAWLRQIDALRAAGKNELADAEMGRFRAAFPGYATKPAPPASSEPPK